MLITGVVEHIQFKNEKNGYTVALVRTIKELVCCVGVMPSVSVGNTFDFDGRWVTHDKYGDQFAVSMVTRVEPKTLKSIVAYIGSGIIKGIGPAMATKIVERFGTDTLAVIKNSPEDLAEIKGISKAKAIEYGKRYLNNIELEEVLAFLQKYSVPIEKAKRIYDVLGENCLEKLAKDPYRIALGEFGISFRIADQIALDVGIEQNGSTRNMAAVEYILTEAASQGNTYCTIAVVVKRVKKMLGASEEAIMSAVLELGDLGRVVLIPHASGEKVYLYDYYQAEVETAARLIHITNVSSNEFEKKDLEILTKQIELSQKITLGEMQKLAVEKALKNGVFVITGGPGTGKTTIIKSIISIFENLGQTIKLAAPTGRAAKRMSETTDRDACTVHRLLELVYSEETEQPFFLRNEDMPIEADVIIIDEVSMVDVLLMNNLLRAVEDGTKLILVGDADQLPSVGAGNVLRDIIGSGMIPCIKLNEVFRQAKESMIVVNSHKINHGEEPILNTKDKDFFFIEALGAEQIAKTVVDVVSRRLPNTYGIDAKQDIQVLTPSRRTAAGVGELNILLQQELNCICEGDVYKEWNGNRFSVGDKVMQIKNNYQKEWTGREKGSFEIVEGKGIFNGDMGTLVQIDEKQNRLLVIFDEDKAAWYDFDEMEELELAYAITVHKSQGCEYPFVVIPIAQFHSVLMTRNLLYTAITRAVKMVVLVGEKRLLSTMIRNNRELARDSSLCEMLKEYDS